MKMMSYVQPFCSLASLTFTSSHSRKTCAFSSRLPPEPRKYRHVSMTLRLQNSNTERTRATKEETCYLVGADLKRKAGNDTQLLSVEESLNELERLAETAGMSVAGKTWQSIQAPFSGTYIGPGKLRSIQADMEALECCTCVFDVELSPTQQRTLEDAFGGEEKGIKVLDRTALILDIFSQHAATREGMLQVELALYQYRLPRLTRMWTHLERQSGAGGVGLRGPGEKQIEVDRRIINSRMSKLKEQIELVRAHRTRQRRSRRKNLLLPVVSLVGYTNAGKSTLMNRLTRSSVREEDMLFATLDPTTRRAQFSDLKLSPEILLTDTVGFIQKLPTMLVAAFRATLEEVVEADALIHVRDASLTPELFSAQGTAVENILAEIGVGKKPILEVWNKLDLCNDPDEVVAAAIQQDAIAVSARKGTGLDDVGAMIEERLRDVMLDAHVMIPYSRGDLVAAVHRQGSVEEEDYSESGTKITAKVPPELLSKLRPFLSLDDAVDDTIEVGGGLRLREEEVWMRLGKGRHDFIQQFSG